MSKKRVGPQCVVCRRPGGKLHTITASEIVQRQGKITIPAELVADVTLSLCEDCRDDRFTYVEACRLSAIHLLDRVGLKP